MKCPRCQTEMQRRKLKEHTFQYRCPKCGLTVGKAESQEEDKYKDAYEIVMGRAEE